MTAQPIIVQGDALRLPLPDGSVDAIVTDPPYNLSFMGRKWDTVGGPQAFQAWCEQWATDALRVLKPGGWLLAFGSTRTFHRLVSGLEDAGFEIRDTIAWMHGSGFPKSLNVSDSVTRSVPPDSRCSCAQRSTDTTSDSPAGYPSRRGSDDEQPRLAAEDGLAPAPSPADAPERSHAGRPLDARGAEQASSGPDGGTGHPSTEGSPALTSLLSGGSRAGDSAHSDRRTSTSPDAATEPHRTDPRRSDMSSWDGGSPWRNQYISACSVCGGVKVQPGLGTALKPAIEFVSVARKPLAGTVAQNVLTFGTGALNIDASRIGYASDEDHAQAEAGTQRMRRTLRDQKMSEGWDRPWQQERPRSESSVTPAGRWPPNVALVHSPGCQPTGTRRIQAHWGQPSDAGDFGKNGVYGQGRKVERRNHADADGMEEVTAWTCEPDCEPDCPVALLDQQSGKSISSGGTGLASGTPGGRGIYGTFGGGASRFMYTAKAGPNERVAIDGEGHPCVKPLSLMRWLVRLVTPPGGTVLDMFAGSGTTGEAAMLEGFRCILIDKDPTNLPSIRVRTHPYVRRTKVITNGQAGPEQGSLL